MNYKVQRLLVIGLLVLLVALAYLVVSSVLEVKGAKEIKDASSSLPMPLVLEDNLRRQSERPLPLQVPSAVDEPKVWVTYAQDYKRAWQQWNRAWDDRNHNAVDTPIVYDALGSTYKAPNQLIPVFACENGQWDPTAVSKTGDYGIAQINKGAHLQEMLDRKLAWTEHDRLVFAEQLYQARGFRDWESSSSCWRRNGL